LNWYLRRSRKKTFSKGELLPGGGGEKTHDKTTHQTKEIPPKKKRPRKKEKALTDFFKTLGEAGWRGGKARRNPRNGWWRRGGRKFAVLGEMGGGGRVGHLITRGGEEKENAGARKKRPPMKDGATKKNCGPPNALVKTGKNHTQPPARNISNRESCRRRKPQFTSSTSEMERGA